MKDDTKSYKTSMKNKIKEREGYHCFLCGDIKELTIAHIFVPKRDYGKPCLENGMCICRKCHDKMDFGLDCTGEEQIRMLRLCEMYLTFFYMREITNEEVTIQGIVKRR